MRFAFLLAPVPLLIAGACSLESGGLSADAGADSPGLEDRGIGMTDSGATCACVPNPGTGWTFIAYQRDGSDACSGSFGMQKFAVEETMTGPAQCACTCAMAPTMDSTCVLTGNYTLDLFKNTNCANSPDKTLTPTPGCFDVNSDYNQNNQQISGKSTVPTITVQGGTCAAPTVNTTTVPTDLHKGQSCTLTGALGSGCMNPSDACVPTVANNFGLCVSNAQADATCPSGFPNKHRVGIGKSDSRTCSACSCQPDPVCAAGARFNEANDCTGGDAGVSFLLDGQCHTVDQATNFNGHSLSSRASVTMQRCSAKGGMPTGTVSLDSEYAICCP